MIRKSYTKSGQKCLVTFTLPKEIEAEVACVLGEFNGWQPGELPLLRRKDGRLSRSVSLPSGRSYRFRYLLNGDRWANEQAADGTVPNPYGSEDSVISL